MKLKLPTLSALFLLCQLALLPAPTWAGRPLLYQWPEVLDSTQATSHEGMAPRRSRFWNNLKPRQIEAVIEIMESNPESDVFFIARDSEYLYDTAKLVYQNSPEHLNRIHLINVSRINIFDANLRAYLEQSGIRAGKKILLVDTGFRGSIPKIIRAHFPPDAQDLISIRLIYSSNRSIPGTAVFFNFTGELDSYAEAGSETLINRMEALPHTTGRSTHFVNQNGTWNAVIGGRSQRFPTDESQGRTSSRGVLQLQRDLVQTISSSEIQSHISARILFWRELNLYERTLNHEAAQQLLDSIKDRDPSFYLKVWIRLRQLNTPLQLTLPSNALPYNFRPVEPMGHDTLQTLLLGGLAAIDDEAYGPLVELERIDLLTALMQEAIAKKREHFFMAQLADRFKVSNRRHQLLLIRLSEIAIENRWESHYLYFMRELIFMGPRTARIRELTIYFIEQAIQSGNDLDLLLYMDDLKPRYTPYLRSLTQRPDVSPQLINAIELELGVVSCESAMTASSEI